MRKLLALLVALVLAAPLAAQTGPKYGKNGGIGSSTSTYSGGEPVPGTYAINGTTGTATVTSYKVKGANGAITTGPAGTAGSVAQFDWLWTNGAYDTSLLGGLWPSPAIANGGLGIARTFTTAVGNAAQSPLWTMGVNNGSASDVVGHMNTCYLKQATGSCFGGNIIAFSDGGLGAVKLVGLEIDIQPGTGSTPDGASNGLILNTWVSANQASALSINTAFGGSWELGMQCAASSVRNGCVVFRDGLSGAAVFVGSDSNYARIFNLGNYLTLSMGTNGFALKDYTTAFNRLVITNAGAIQFSTYGAGTLHTDSSGNVTSGALPSLQLTAIAFASLPTCNAGAEGALYAVNNSNSATFNATMAGGGSNHVMAYCNGSNWTVH